jgi:hypothetical protein
MLPVLPLLIADPSLPEEVRLSLLGSPEEGVRALVELGVSCCDAYVLAAGDEILCE